jgi:dihydrofolate reductase
VTPPAGEESDPDVAKAMNNTPKIVISRTLPQATWAGTQIISNHAEEELAKLKTQQFTSGNVLLYYQPITR